MTDTNTTTTEATPAATAAAAKVKTTLEGMTGYRTFDSTEEATAYLAKCGQDFADFADQPFALNKVNDAGEYDPEAYGPDSRVRVAVLRNVPRTINGKKEPTTIKAIVVTPVPTMQAILGIDGETFEKIKATPGFAWATKVIDKELNHVAVRPLRDAENLSTAIAEMPVTLADFIESNRESGGILDTFNDLYKTINDKMAEKSAPWARRKPNKGDLKRCMESTAYALEYYSTLEDRGEGNESLFVKALQFGIALAKHKGMDAAIFTKWLETRDAQTLATEESTDEEGDINIDDLVADLEPAAAEATDSTEAQPAAE